VGQRTWVRTHIEPRHLCLCTTRTWVRLCLDAPVKASGDSSVNGSFTDARRPAP
jgi:hypothetical protein